MTVKPDLDYQAHLSAGRFMLPADAATRTPFYPPRATVPGSASTDIVWVEVSGRGIVYSATTVHRKPPEESFNVALIDLAERPRMMSRVEGIPPADVCIGMAVTARIDRLDDGEHFVIFAPEATA